MRAPGNLVVRSSALLLLAGAFAILGTGPSQALVAGLTVDDFNGGGPAASRTVSDEGAGSVAFSPGAAKVSVIGDYGVSATISWTFTTAQDLTAGGKADQLEMDYSSVTSSNPSQSAVVGDFTLTATDTSGATSSAFGSTSRSQTVSEMPFGNVTGGLQGDADLSKIKSIALKWLPGEVVSGGTDSNVITISKIWSLNPVDVQGQTIQFTSTAPTNAVVGGAYDVTATGGGSGQPVVFGVGAGTTNAACTVTSAGHVSFAHAGDCFVTANQAGSGSYTAAPQVSQEIAVGKAAQTITFTSTAPATGTIGGTYDVTATGGGSGAPVVFSVGSGTTNSACTVSGSTVTFAHAGTCAVAADQAGNADYDAAAQKTQSISVGKAGQTITFTSTAPDPASIGGTYDVTATGGGSGAPVVFSVGSGTTNSACTVTGSTVTFAHAGTCAVAADQAGDADHDAAPQVSQQITVQKTAQAITFTSTAPDPSYVGTTYDITATGGGSGNAVTFSSSSAACTVTGSTVTFVAAGPCSVEADQAGAADYDAAPTVSQPITVTTVPSTVAVSLTPTSTVFGQVATATAVVTPSRGDAAGSVQFQVDGVDTGGPVTLVDGSASLDLPADLAAGSSHQIDAHFVPSDPVTFASADGSGTLPVAQASTGTTVSVTADAISATVTATAPGAGTPTGEVSFLVNGTVVGSADLDQGTATFAYTVPTGRSNAVAAEYLGDTDFLASSASVNRNDPTISARVTAKPARSKWGWYRGRVVVSFTCATSGSPLTTPCPAAVTLGRQGAGQSVSRTIAAADGGIATVSLGGIDIDHTAPSVRIAGLTSGGHYVSAPKARCKSSDKLSGIASCRLTHKRLRNGRVRYTAVATDKAGNTARRQVTIALRLHNVTLLGLAAHGGAYDVRAGASYTLVVLGGPRPRYVNAAPAPQRPHGLSVFFRRVGSVGGKPRWEIGVTMSPGMGGRTWNLGVLQGGKLRVVRVRVH